MDYHKNARLTAVSRERLARIVVMEGVSVASAAARFSVTPKTAAKWVGRYPAVGGCRHGRSQFATAPQPAPDMFFLGGKGRCSSPAELHPASGSAAQLGLSPATVSRILRRVRLSRWRDLNPLPPVQRYEHPLPGDLLHLDIKGLTRFRRSLCAATAAAAANRSIPASGSARGHRRSLAPRLHPDAARSEDRNHHRLSARCPRLFRRHGISVRALLTDNGSTYRSHQFRQACQTSHIKHRRTRPYTPRTNGKAERFIQTALREWAYAKHWKNSEERDSHLAALDPLLQLRKTPW